MTHQSDNPHPVDLTSPLTGGRIPDADLDRLIAATMPPGFHTDDDPDADLRTFNGIPHAVPGRQVGAYAVVILDRDGQISDDFVTVEVGEAERDLTLHEARQLALAVTAAADDLLRVSGLGALRAALAAADPALLTAQDRLALLDLFSRAMDAVFAQPQVDTSRVW